MPASTENKKLEPKDVPSAEDCNKLKDGIRGVLNPDGKNEAVDGYINSTFDYIQSVLNKVANAEDQQAASKEVADDIVSKLKGWAESKQAGAQVAEKEKITEGGEKAEATEKTESAGEKEKA